MLQYAQVLEEGVLLQRSSSAAAFYLNRVMVIAQDAADGSLNHLKAISFCALQFAACHCSLTFISCRSSVAACCQRFGWVKILLKYISKRGCLQSKPELTPATAAVCLPSLDAS